MSMRKYQSTEKVEVLPPAQQRAISENLHALGKTSAKKLTDAERRALDVKHVV